MALPSGSESGSNDARDEIDAEDFCCYAARGPVRGDGLRRVHNCNCNAYGTRCFCRADDDDDDTAETRETSRRMEHASCKNDGPMNLWTTTGVLYCCVAVMGRKENATRGKFEKKKETRKKQTENENTRNDGVPEMTMVGDILRCV